MPLSLALGDRGWFCCVLVFFGRSGSNPSAERDGCMVCLAVSSALEFPVCQGSVRVSDMSSEFYVEDCS